MSDRTERPRIAVVLGVSLLLAAAIFILPLGIGIWLPDVFVPTPRVVSEAKTGDGYTLRVVQYWGGDFYTTELHIVPPDGKPDVRVLDVDDDKAWRVPLTVDEQHRSVSLVLTGGRVKQESW